MTPHDALNLIVNGRPDQLRQWAEQNGVEPSIMLAFNSYTPTWRATAEHRGAVVFILRAIAGKALDDEFAHQ